MKLKFIKNKIEFFPEINEKIRRNIYTKVIEEFNETLLKITKIKNNKRNFHDYFNMNGFSLWWISDTIRKDTEIDNEWLNILFILKLSNKQKIEEIETDNNILIQLLRKNSIKVNCIKIRNKKYFFKKFLFKFYLIYRSLYNIFSKTVLLIALKLKLFGRQIDQLKRVKTNIWFKSIFPANWVKNEQGLNDRHFNNIYNKKNFGLILHLREYGKKLNILKLYGEINKLDKNLKNNFFFPEAQLSLTDILKAQFSTFKYFILYKKFIRENSDFNNIKMGSLKISYLIENQFYNFYFNSFFNILLEGYATYKFFSLLKKKQILITYGEFFVHNRFAYHNFKKINLNNIIISIQHSMNGRFYGATYNNKSEFNQNNKWDSIMYSPAPDYYLAQGEQYQKILNTFYPKKNTSIIGSFKTKLYLDKIKRKSYYKNKIDKYFQIEGYKLCLIAPSSNDLNFIFNFLKTFNFPKKWKVIISPHRASSISLLKKLSNYFIINQKFSTIELLTRANLIITGFSSLAHESALFKVPACRLINVSEMPLYEDDINVSLIKNHEDLNKTFASLSKNQISENFKRSYEYYYFRTDAKADERFYSFINKLNN